MQYRTEIAIDAPADVVWPIMSGVERWPEWTASVEKVERLEDGPFQVGSSARVKQPKLPVAVWTVTALDEGRSFSWEAKGPGVRTVGMHEIEDAGGNAVKVVLSIRSTGFLAPVMGLFISGLTRRYVDTEAQGLKQRAESETAAGG